MTPVNTNNTAKLKYDILSFPTGILHANNPQHTLRTIISITISNPTPDTPISLDDIKINLPVGAKESDLLYRTSTADDIHISIKGLDGLEVTASDIHGREGIITAISVIIEEEDGDPFIISTQKITLTIHKIQINEVVGHAQIKITEESEQGDKGKLTKELSKWPTKFEFENFLPSQDYILVPPGEVKLTWDGSPDAVYHLFYPEFKNGIVIKNGQHTVRGLSEDTTFRLEAMYHKGSLTLKKALRTSVKVEKPFRNFKVNSPIVNFCEEVTLFWDSASIDPAYKVEFFMNIVDIIGHAERIKIEAGQKSVKFPVCATTTFTLEATYLINNEYESYTDGQIMVGCKKELLAATIIALEKCYIDTNNTEIKVLLKNTTPDFEGHLLITSDINEDIRIDIARTKRDFEVKYTLPKFYAPINIALTAQDLWNGKTEEITDSKEIEFEVKDPKENLNFAVFVQKYTLEHLIFDYYLFYEPKFYKSYQLTVDGKKHLLRIEIPTQTKEGLVYQRDIEDQFSGTTPTSQLIYIKRLGTRHDYTRKKSTYHVGSPFKGTAKFKVLENNLSSFKFELDYEELKKGQIIIEVFDILEANKLALIHQAFIETEETSGKKTVEFETPFSEQHFPSKKDIKRKIVFWAHENSQYSLRRRIESKVFTGK